MIITAPKYGECATLKPLELEGFEIRFILNPVEFDGIRMQTGLNSFTLTPKQWSEKTAAIGIVSQAGRFKRMGFQP
jgi:hypothetical protein